MASNQNLSLHKNACFKLIPFKLFKYHLSK